MIHNTPELKQCKMCKRWLEPNDSNFTRNPNGNFKSPCRDCMRERNKNIKRNERNRTQKDGQEYVVCQVCGKEYVQITESHTLAVHGMRLSEYKDKYPDTPISSENFKTFAGERSRDMWVENHDALIETHKEAGKRVSGTFSPHWKGGIKKGAAKAVSRQKAIMHYGAKCMIPGCTFDYVVHNHHINPRSEGGSYGVENCIILCPNHHALADGGLLSREYLFNLIERFNKKLTDNNNQKKLL